MICHRNLSVLPLLHGLENRAINAQATYALPSHVQCKLTKAMNTLDQKHGMVFISCKYSVGINTFGDKSMAPFVAM